MRTPSNPHHQSHRRVASAGKRANNSTHSLALKRSTNRHSLWSYYSHYSDATTLSYTPTTVLPIIPIITILNIFLIFTVLPILLIFRLLVYLSTSFLNFRSFLTIPGLLAHPSFDVWSLGCVLYQMCSQGSRALFHADSQDNLAIDRNEDDNLFALYAWKDEVKARKLARVTSTPLTPTTTSPALPPPASASAVVSSSSSAAVPSSSVLPAPPAASDNPNNHHNNEYTYPYQPLDPHPLGLARNLIAQMLHKDPFRRPTLHRVLAHPFMTHLTTASTAMTHTVVASHPVMTSHPVTTQSIIRNRSSTQSVTTLPFTTHPASTHPISTYRSVTHPNSTHRSVTRRRPVVIPRMLGQQPTFDIYISYRSAGQSTINRTHTQNTRHHPPLSYTIPITRSARYYKL